MTGYVAVNLVEKTEPVPSGKLLRKCQKNWRLTIGRVPETRNSLDTHQIVYVYCFHNPGTARLQCQNIVN